MSISDDPRFRRGQPGNAPYNSGQGRGEEPRQPVRQDPRNGPRPAPSRNDDRAPPYRDGNAPQDAAERSSAASRQQPAFSAYRPEAYAAGDKPYAAGDKRGVRADRAEWDQSEHEFGGERAANRAAPEPYRPAPAPDRGRPQHDPYHSVANDPYDNGGREFDQGWRAEGYEDPNANQFPASGFYSQHDEPGQPDVQSVHDRFFAANSEPDRAPAPPPAQPAGRYRAPDYNAHDYAADEREVPRPGKPVNGHANFENAGDYRWDSFDQPAPVEAARPFPHAKTGREEDLDADYFADEDEFEGEEDYAEAKKGGSKKLMAAVLIGAVVTGGGLAYLYKSQTGDEGSAPPIMTADMRPVKEKPSAPGGREFPNGGKMIYDRLDNGAPGDQTRLARGEPQSDASTPGVVTTGASGTLEERIQNALRDAKKADEAPDNASSNSANQASPDTPRPVRTEVIRPDGTAESSRVQRRQAPTEGETSLAGASRGVVSREAPPAAAPIAAPRTQIAAATPAQLPASASAGGDAGMFVQIAARNDQAAAMAAFADLQQKYASVLGNHSPSVRKVDLGDKGVWYRLLVGPMPSKPDADKLCEDLKTAGMKGCFSRKE